MQHGAVPLQWPQCLCPHSGTIPHVLQESTAPTSAGRSSAPQYNVKQEETLLTITKWGILIMLLTGNVSEVETIVQNVSTPMNQLLPKGKSVPFEKC